MRGVGASGLRRRGQDEGRRNMGRACDDAIRTMKRHEEACADAVKVVLAREDGCIWYTTCNEGTRRGDQALSPVLRL